MSKLKLENNKTKITCNCCGFTCDYDEHYKLKFNINDSTLTNDYCIFCHPKRMTFKQLIQWLAMGHGYVCMQSCDYTTSLNFSLSNGYIYINKQCYKGDLNTEIPYDEHNFVVRYFDDEKNKNYWNIPTYEMWVKDCKTKL